MLEKGPFYDIQNREKMCPLNRAFPLYKAERSKNTLNEFFSDEEKAFRRHIVVSKENSIAMDNILVKLTAEAKVVLGRGFFYPFCYAANHSAAHLVIVSKNPLL